MKSWKRGAALAAAACLLVGLTACGGGNKDAKDATIFIQGELDATYKGTYVQDYLDVVVDMTADDVKEQYEYNLSAEADYMVYDFLGAEVPTDAVMEKAEEVLKEIYAKSKYTVADAEKMQNGDLAAEVTVSPIELFHLIDEDFHEEAMEKALTAVGLTEDDFADMTEEKYMAVEEAFCMAYLDEVAKQVPNATYGKDQSVMLQLKMGEDGYYSLVETGIQKVDEIMIDYYGVYLEG